MTSTTRTEYAIVNARGEIVSLHSEPVPPGEGWGHDHELVELRRSHRMGDVIEWDARGVEIDPDICCAVCGRELDEQDRCPMGEDWRHVAARG